MRGCLACRILKPHGFTPVKNLTGGLKTYAWATEKQANPDIVGYKHMKRRAQAGQAAPDGSPAKCAWR